jgi:hypothetical protein
MEELIGDIVVGTNGILTDDRLHMVLKVCYVIADWC